MKCLSLAHVTSLKGAGCSDDDCAKVDALAAKLAGTPGFSLANLIAFILASLPALPGLISSLLGIFGVVVP